MNLSKTRTRHLILLLLSNINRKLTEPIPRTTLRLRRRRSKKSPLRKKKSNNPKPNFNKSHESQGSPACLHPLGKDNTIAIGSYPAARSSVPTFNSSLPILPISKDESPPPTLVPNFRRSSSKSLLNTGISIIPQLSRDDSFYNTELLAPASVEIPLPSVQDPSASQTSIPAFSAQHDVAPAPSSSAFVPYSRTSSPPSKVRSRSRALLRSRERLPPTSRTSRPSSRDDPFQSCYNYPRYERDQGFIRNYSSRNSLSPPRRPVYGRYLDDSRPRERADSRNFRYRSQYSLT